MKEKMFLLSYIPFSRLMNEQVSMQAAWQIFDIYVREFLLRNASFSFEQENQEENCYYDEILNKNIIDSKYFMLRNTLSI